MSLGCAVGKEVDGSMVSCIWVNHLNRSHLEVGYKL